MTDQEKQTYWDAEMYARLMSQRVRRFGERGTGVTWARVLGWIGFAWCTAIAVLYLGAVSVGGSSWLLLGVEPALISFIVVISSYGAPRITGFSAMALIGTLVLAVDAGWLFWPGAIFSISSAVLYLRDPNSSQTSGVNA